MNTAGMIALADSVRRFVAQRNLDAAQADERERLAQRLGYALGAPVAADEMVVGELYGSLPTAYNTPLE